MIDACLFHSRLTMKLLTHNFLASNVPNVKCKYPLGLFVEQIEMEENEFDAAFVVCMIPRINYAVLRKAAQLFDVLPEEPPADAETNEGFLKALHHALTNIDIVEGKLICFESKREFPIKGGIPNMLLNDFEIAN